MKKKKTKQLENEFFSVISYTPPQNMWIWILENFVPYQKRKSNQERDNKIYQDRISGESFENIGRLNNISGSRARQIYLRINRIKNQ